MSVPHLDGSLALYVNDVDIQDVGDVYGFRWSIEDMDGPTGIAPALDATDVPGGAGAVITSERASYLARDFKVSLRVYGNSVEDVATSFRLLRQFVSRGVVRLRTDLAPQYEATARLSADEEHYDQLASFCGLIALTFRMDDPLWYALTPTVLAVLPGERVRLPVGSAPSEVVATIMGPSASPTQLIYRDARGVPVAGLSLDIGLSVNEFVTVRGDVPSIQVTSAGVLGTIPDGFALLSSDSDFPVIDPADAAGFADALLGPTLEVSDLAGTASAVVSYVQAIA